jgi:hypothetical protein
MSDEPSFWQFLALIAATMAAIALILGGALLAAGIVPFVPLKAAAALVGAYVGALIVSTVIWFTVHTDRVLSEHRVAAIGVAAMVVPVAILATIEPSPFRHIPRGLQLARSHASEVKPLLTHLRTMKRTAKKRRHP